MIAALVLLAIILFACVKRPRQRSDANASISPVPPREGTPINQAAVLPEREKIILKKPPAP